MKKSYLIEDVGVADIENKTIKRGKIEIINKESKERTVSFIPDGDTAEYTDGLTVLSRLGKIAMPAFCDIRCVIGDTGRKNKSVESELFNAMKSGYGAICPMPGGEIIPDTPSMFRSYYESAAASMYLRIIPSAYTVRQSVSQMQMSDIDGLIKNGCRVFFADGNSTPGNVLSAMKKIATSDALYICSPCNSSLSEEKAFEGEPSVFGLPYIPRAAETVACSENIILSRESGCRIHIPCVRLKETVDMIRAAKEEGIRVTASTAPQYFTYTEREVLFRGAMAKLMPPLGKDSDREAVIQGVADGTIDCISSDHISISESRKNNIADADYGSVGFETAFAASFTNLVRNERADIIRVIEAMTTAPLGILLGKKVTTREAMEKSGVVLADLSAGMRYTKNSVNAAVWTSVFDGSYLYGKITDNFN